MIAGAALLRARGGFPAAPAGNITHVLTNTANGTSQNIPESLAGDLAICLAMRVSNGTVPSIPDIDPDWLTPSGANITASHSDTCGGVLVYQFRPEAGTEDDRSSGAFTNAQRIILPSYRGASGIIAAAWASGTGTSINIPGLSGLSSTSWVGLAYSHGGTTPATPPGGWEQRVVGPTRSYVDSDGPLSSFSGATATLADSLSWIACAIAIEPS